MYTVWTEHLTEKEDKENFQKGLHNCEWVLERLDEILKQKEEALETNEVNPSAYDSPSWAYKQAHSNGFKHCLKIVRKLITLDQKENEFTRK
jgi:hypothetical protein